MGANELDYLSTRTERDDGPREAEREEEQSGLIPLLQQMSLAELRDIARQRDWRVAGTSKADYVEALAAQLCDPTETARAVARMSEDLREALRAALVADDGSGITAASMAQTMTALRSAPPTRSQDAARPEPGRVSGAGLARGERVPGQTVKPVEAAALLIDLARWGLVLPWRDSLFGQGRHVLPWHIQRQLPPLAGWCAPAAHGAPSTEYPARGSSNPAERGSNCSGSTLARDAREFVSTLYAVWEAIAAEQPPVRPNLFGAEAEPAPAPLASPASRGRRSEALYERPYDRRLQSLLQGWPYEPQELQRWTSNRRRAEASTQSLAVPTPAFLVEDAALPVLARLAGGNGGGYEELEFQCHLLCEMGLVRIEDGHLQAQREPMVRFLQLRVADQHREAARAYLSLLDWSEVNLLLRGNPRLVLWRRPYFAIAYDQFLSSLVRLRHLLLRFVACAGEQGWCELGTVEAALRRLWPHFSAALQGDRESWFTQAWGLAWRSDGHEPEASERPAAAEIAETAAQDAGAIEIRHLPANRSPADWQASQGMLLRLILEGPLHWLGLAELSYSDGQLAAFRLHGLADCIWDRPTVLFDVEDQPQEVLKIDESTNTISLQPGCVAPQALTFLGRIAHLEQASPKRFVYHLHPRAILPAFESGAALTDLLSEWEQVMPQAIPDALQETLSEWWRRYGQVRLYDGFGLLELRDEVTLRELEAGTSLSKHIVARLSPRVVLVRDEAVDGLLKEFAAKGYTPKELD